MRRLNRHLPKALAGNADAVHEMRVSARRLRVALRLLSARPDSRRRLRCHSALKALGDTAGSSRDLDVSVDLLERRLAEGQFDADGRIVLRRLRAARGQSRRRLGERLLDLDIARLRRGLRTLSSKEPASVVEALERLAAELRKKGAELQRGVGEAPPDSAETLHGLRILARRMRYAAEIADALRGRASDSAAAFKAIQDEMGAIHDLQVLAARLTRMGEGWRARGHEDVARTALQMGTSFAAEADSMKERLWRERLRERVEAGLASAGGGERSAA